MVRLNKEEEEDKADDPVRHLRFFTSAWKGRRVEQFHQFKLVKLGGWNTTQAQLGRDYDTPLSGSLKANQYNGMWQGFWMLLSCKRTPNNSMFVEILERCFLWMVKPWHFPVSCFLLGTPSDGSFGKRSYFPACWPSQKWKVEPKLPMHLDLRLPKSHYIFSWKVDGATATPKS